MGQFYVLTKVVQELLQSGVGNLLQSGVDITNQDKFITNGAGITKWGYYYKVGHCNYIKPQCRSKWS